MEILKCNHNCCQLTFTNYNSNTSYETNKHQYINKKAGVFIFDPTEEKVLLVQSRGNLWGLPKGTLQKNENNKDCAIREVKEETGLILFPNDLHISVNIHNTAVYYYLEKSVCKVSIQSSIKNNDANGIGWIKFSCLREMIRNNQIFVNQHCRLILKHFNKF